MSVKDLEENTRGILSKINEQLELINKIKNQLQLVRKRLIERAAIEGFSQKEIEDKLRRIEDNGENTGLV